MFVITCQTPGGHEYAWSVRDQAFALVPVVGDVFRNASAWDTEPEAREYMDRQLEIAPELEKLGPFEILAVEVAN